MASGSSLSLEDIKRWKVPQLKDYLRKRKFKTTGKKDELCALVYAAHVEDKPVAISAEEERRLKASVYLDLLEIEGSIIPDPFYDLKEGWICEDMGMSEWPPTLHVDIATFLLNHVKDGDLTKRLLSDYKEGKAYSYFDSDWLKEVFYHPVSQESKYCVLKSESTPSQRLNHPPHNIWVAVEKKSGTIMSAYCTCFAGLGSTCNHVAAVLFKVDHAWRMGWTSPACTSRPCTWNQYGSKTKTIEPRRISEMEWRKPHYRKMGKSEQINPPARQLFKPVSKKQNEEEKRNGLVNALFDTCPHASAFQYLTIDARLASNPSDDVNVVQEVEVSTSVGNPTTLLGIAKTMTEECPWPSLRAEEIVAIEHATRSQSLCDIWRQQRVGRITGSTAHSVLTKVRTLSKKPGSTPTNPSSLVGRLLAKSQPSENIPALKYGREMENDALEAYKIQKRLQGHTDLSIVKCGLFIHPHKIYIGASPDGLVSCSCCGLGLVELKCPFSISSEDPNNVNLPYITRVPEIRLIGNKKLKYTRLTLNPNHNYYSQVIFQMGVTDRKWCDFFVYTKYGHLLLPIKFDEHHWNELTAASERFFHEYIAPELIHTNIQLTSPVSAVDSSTTPTPSTSQSMSSSSLLSHGSSQLITYQTPACTHTARRKMIKRPRIATTPLYFCALCDKPCRNEEDIILGDDNSVQCERCHKWYHWGCAGYVPDDDDDDDTWFCLTCLC